MPVCSEYEEATVAGIGTLSVFFVMEQLFPNKLGLQVFATSIAHYLILKKLMFKKPFLNFVHIGGPQEMPDYSSRCTSLSESDHQSQLEGLVTLSGSVASGDGQWEPYIRSC